MAVYRRPPSKLGVPEVEYGLGKGLLKRSSTGTGLGDGVMVLFHDFDRNDGSRGDSVLEYSLKVWDYFLS